MLTRAHFMPYLNQPVELDMTDGTTRRGILHSVTNDGVYLRPMNGTRLASGDEVQGIELADQVDQFANVQEAFFPFFFFFPFLFIRRFRFRGAFV